MPEKLQHPAYGLAFLADCGSPDSPTSPGAEMLLSVQDAVNDHLTECDGPHDDCTHEIADGAPDVYTHQRWLEFVDLAAYQEDASELGASVDDLTGAAGIALYMIAERLALALFEEAEVSTFDDDDDE